MLKRLRGDGPHLSDDEAAGNLKPRPSGVVSMARPLGLTEDEAAREEMRREAKR
jgi:hypothetical protein